MSTFIELEHENRKRDVWCPHCNKIMLHLYDLVDHVKHESCGMTLQRLLAVGVLDDGDIKAYEEQAASKLPR